MSEGGDAKREYLVQLALTAWDRVHGPGRLAGRAEVADRPRFAEEVSERMAQAGAAWELEAPMATLAEVDRALDRVRVLTETVDRLEREKQTERRDRYLLEGKLESTRAALMDEARAHTETRENLTRLREAAERVTRLEASLPTLLDVERVADATKGGAPDEGWGADAPAEWVRWRIARDAVRIQRAGIHDANAEVLRLANALTVGTPALAESAPSRGATARPPTNLERVTLEAVRSDAPFAEAFAKAAKEIER